ncbi:Uncharacterised protein [Salmonella enterica]|uniref:Uncharacterized protein n=1 Tax=Salmonella enterica TaxID=28901 RepID=A0A379QG96_SALER|nr:Uncharacterised protein [Salmonella enterica]
MQMLCHRQHEEGFLMLARYRAQLLYGQEVY